MNGFNIGLTIDTIGKIMLGITVLMVHWHILKEHKIDIDVLRTMKREQILGISGILLILAGYIMQLIYHT